MQILEWGYNYCEQCLINANAGQPLDVSHKESVKVCLESGQAQKAYSVDNLRVLCRKCHREHDKTALNSSSNASERQNGHH